MGAMLPSLSSKLGECSYCMRKAFQSAIGTFASVAVAIYLTAPTLIVLSLASLAVLLTLLWIAHLIAFASRRANSHRLPSGSVTRRSVVTTFARAFVGVALATSVPSRAVAANCSVTCPNGTTASRTCDDGKGCTCRCNNNGNAVCDPCE